MPFQYTHSPALERPGDLNSAFDKCAKRVTASGMYERLRYEITALTSRFFSYYGVILLSVLNLATMSGFMILKLYPWRSDSGERNQWES